MKRQEIVVSRVRNLSGTECPGCHCHYCQCPVISILLDFDYLFTLAIQNNVNYVVIILTNIHQCRVFSSVDFKCFYAIVNGQKRLVFTFLPMAMLSLTCPWSVVGLHECCRPVIANYLFKK